MSPSNPKPKGGGIGLAILADGPPKVRGPEDSAEPDMQDQGGDNPDGQSCDSCYYYRGSQCKRYPQAVPKQPGDWSGEWKAKDQQANDTEEAGESAGMTEGSEGEYGG